ncbi:MAG TPA: GNAT family N-acetyltransferase [Nocardioides sp.]|nr:GNAT family N-acetyltransferase [Nocardioides sp.]
MSWLPSDFEHPRVAPVTTDHHLRPIRAEDVDLDMPAVMGSQQRLWSIYGEAWGWPPATMTVEQDREDLARHEAEAERHESFNYALFDDAENELVGCVYIDPPEKAGADADVSWWVRDEYLGSPVEAALDDFVPRWMAERWPFERPRYVGRDLSWEEWAALPPVDSGGAAP